VSLTHCTKKQSTVSSSDGSTINIGNGGEPQDLDPAITTGVPEDRIIMQLFEALVSLDPKTTEPVPGVAESWTMSKDGKTYTFKIRQNAKWSNGDPMTANDFVYSWRRLVDPNTAAEYAYQGYYFKNGEDINKGKIKDLTQLGVRAVDDHTLEVSLNNPTPFFLGLLSHHSLFPVHKATVEKFGKQFTRPGNLVSNGPFMLDTWETNKMVSLKKNPNYWDQEKVALQRANFFVTENLTTEEKMFRTGQLHVTYEVPYEKLDFWKADKTGVFRSEPYIGVYYYLLNTAKAPLNDKRVRKALNYGIDRTALVEKVVKGNQAPANAFTPPGTGGYTAKAEMPVDGSRIAEAKKLLKEAGYGEGGKPLPPLEVLYNTHEGHKKTAEALQEMWKKNLGIDVKIYNQEWKVYLDSMHNQNYQIARRGWIADYNDPNAFLDLFLTGGGNNNTGFANKTYDGLIKKAGETQDPAKRLAIFQEAESLLLDELPCIPLYYYKKNYLIRPEVTGWDPNVLDKFLLKQVRLNPTS